MSLSTGLQYSLGKRLSTTISMFFPLSKRFTLNDLESSPYSLKLGMRALRVSGWCAIAAREAMK